MRWKGLRESDNVEDRRGKGARIALGGGLGTVILIIIVALLGGDPRALLQDTGSLSLDHGAATSGSYTPTAAEEERTHFVRTILASTEDVWHDQFRKMGRQYREPTLVLFSARVQSACGAAGASAGPFYCPADEKLYIDLSFFDELARRYRAPGDFAQAYVIAHEVGHHVQNLLGLTDQVDAARRQLSPAEFNRLSTRLELQADFLAGVWAHHAQQTKRILEEGDIEEGLRAASAIGDDTLQKRAQGYAVPDSFTHGTSAQRVKWFRKGLNTGDVREGDTFNMPDP